MRNCGDRIVAAQPPPTTKRASAFHVERAPLDRYRHEVGRAPVAVRKQIDRPSEMID